LVAAAEVWKFATNVLVLENTQIVLAEALSEECSALLSSLSGFNRDGGTTAIGTSFGAGGAGLLIGEAKGDTAVWSGRTLGAVVCSVASLFLLSSPQPFTCVFCSSRNCWYHSLSPVVCDTLLAGTFSLLTTSELVVKKKGGNY